MAGNSYQRKIQVNISSSLLQAAVKVLRSTVNCTSVIFGVLRSTLQTLTTLGSYTSVQTTPKRITTSTVATVCLSVAFCNIIILYSYSQYPHDIVKKNTIKGTINRQFPCFFRMPHHAGSIGIVYP